MPKCYDTSYEKGNFLQHYIQPSEFDVDEFQDPRDYFGLTRHLLPIYGCMRDEEGNMYEVLHNLVPRYAKVEEPALPTLYQSTLVDGENMLPDQNLMAKGAKTVRPESRREGDKLICSKIPGDPGCDWEMTFTKDKFTWKEEGFIDFEGEIMSPGCQWAILGPDYGQFYLSQFVRLHGTLDGKKVEGAICIDQCYMHPENAFIYTKKDIVLENKGHLLWYMFLNEYDDGYIEWGEFEVCHDKMGFGFLADNEGNVRIARDNISCELEDLGDENPFTGRIDLHFDDEEWEFTPDPKGKMPILLKRYPPTPQQEGWWHRKGETRKPIAHFAWGETERMHGLDCHEKLPARE
ncbi:MAG: hypothetical protein IJH88_03845 [Eggerthellaceae bacterium]|nr:hypothetical protein [Eggerthellaceae bacterium]